MKTVYVLMQNDYPFCVYKNEIIARESREILEKQEWFAREKARQERRLEVYKYYHIEETKYDPQKE